MDTKTCLVHPIGKVSQSIAIELGTHTHTHTARFGGLFRALRRSLIGHIARLWLWLWLWLRLLNPLEFLQLNDRSNGFAGQFAAPLRITCARQRFSPVNPHPILSFIKSVYQRSNALTIILR
jgi:hypothetical protein